MAGILYGVGVGPGDPELMTLKAVRVIRENEIIAVPGKTADADPRETVAYKIAKDAVEGLGNKELLSLFMPMTKDAKTLENSHNTAVVEIEKKLNQGKNVVFLTLGDPSVYSTFSYIQRSVCADGYEVEIISGVPSFCAVAAAIKEPLAVWEEPIHIYPGTHSISQGKLDKIPVSGTCVFMKSGSKIEQVRDMLQNTKRDVYMVTNCGMPEEQVYHGLEQIPGEAGYFSIIVAKEDKS